MTSIVQLRTAAIGEDDATTGNLASEAGFAESLSMQKSGMPMTNCSWMIVIPNGRGTCTEQRLLLESKFAMHQILGRELGHEC